MNKKNKIKMQTLETKVLAEIDAFGLLLKEGEEDPKALVAALKHSETAKQYLAEMIVLEEFTKKKQKRKLVTKNKKAKL